MTKEETINYINKKIKEGLGFAGDEVYVNNNSITGSECNLTYNVKYSSMPLVTVKHTSFEDVGLIKTSLQFTFDLTLVKEIQDLGGNESLGKFKITLTSKSGKQRLIETEVVKIRRPGADERERLYPNDPEWTLNYKKTIETKNEESFSNYVYVYYLKSDESSFIKLKKAFDHLSALCKAEDDPFGN